MNIYDGIAEKNTSREVIEPNDLNELSKFDVRYLNVVDFPPFRLDLDSGKLSRDGSELRLGIKTRTLLLDLVRNANRVLSIGEVMKAVWKNPRASSDRIAHALEDLRHSLQDESNTSKFVETFKNGDCRFCGVVDDARMAS